MRASVDREHRQPASGFRNGLGSTQLYLKLDNVGGSAARAVALSWVPGEEGPEIYGAGGGVAHLPDGASVRFALVTVAEGPGSGTLRLTWQDDEGAPYEELQSIQVW